jgi:hypothetical protein
MKLYNIAYRMSDASEEKEIGTPLMVHVLAPSYDDAVEIIKQSYTKVRPRRLTDFTLVREYDTNTPQRVGYTEFYRGFEVEEEIEDQD